MGDKGLPLQLHNHQAALLLLWWKTMILSQRLGKITLNLAIYR